MIAIRPSFLINLIALMTLNTLKTHFQYPSVRCSEDQ